MSPRSSPPPAARPPPAPHRIFLLSPANCGGERAGLLLRPQASFALALRLRSPAGAPLGEVFQFASGLYFRGKLAYARAFARPPPGLPGALVISPGQGLLQVDQRIHADHLRAFAQVSIDLREPRYRLPLERDARALACCLDGQAEVVLLGSIASGKYVEVLSGILKERLRFPAAFVGRGDMSRGGLMLRSARSGEELAYVAFEGAVRHGPRPSRLPRPRRAGPA